MLSIPRGVKIFLALEPTDLRKGIDGLSALVMRDGEDVFSDHLFVFVSRRRDRLKILAWDTGGFIVYYKRLEKGRFQLPAFDSEKPRLPLDAAQLHLLLDGIDFTHFKRPRLWEPPARDCA